MNNQQKIPKRLLGKTGRKLSVIGFGGIVVMNAELEHAKEVVAEVVEKGINYFDVAPTYGDAELKLGPALKPFRDKCFLACKTGRRDRAGAKQELDNSLKNLKTDHFDLYQLHAISDVESDVKAALAKDGAIQTFLDARKQGVIDLIGFSAHSPQAALAAMREFDFDTILYPVNFCCHFQGSFDQEVLVEAQRRNMGIFALKSMAKQKWQNDEDRKAYPKCWYEPISEPEITRLALRWTLSQGVTAAIPPGEEQLFRMALAIAATYKDLSADELSRLEKLPINLQHIFSA
jgi:aryl-alcohol dehydrogenase-like predicted oxidoreductase